MRKTKIICTMGPSTEKGDTLKKLIEAGMNVARMNFSHGDFDEHGGRLKSLRKYSKELGLPVAALLDTKGPEVRIGLFENGSITLSDSSGDVPVLYAQDPFNTVKSEVEGGTNYMTSYGVTRQSIVRELEAHENDDYYLGTHY